MRVYMIRHGQSEANARNAHAGWAQVPLTDKGVAQARAAQERLSALKFDKVIVSDLLRAQQTAQNALPGYEYLTDWRVREMNVGSLSGYLVPECEEKYGEEYKVHRKERNFAPYGGENLEQLRQRVCSFMDDMAKEPEDANIAVVCHEGAMIMMLMQVMQCDVRYFPAYADNCCVSVFTYKSGQWTVNKWNETGNVVPEHH